LLDLTLFRIRTFGAAVSGSFFTRLGIGGVPFLLPLLYQVGLGYTPVQSGLLIMPQAAAAMSTKFLMPKILERVGFRGVLISNTIILGLLLMLFATIGTAELGPVAFYSSDLSKPEPVYPKQSQFGLGGAE
jgi:MFS family permease